jgi:hypothetical protein
MSLDFLFNSKNLENSFYNVNTSHPLIPNSQNYHVYRKFLSIHSEDRNIINFPRSNEFEIELPEDITNIFSARLVTWTFPSNYYTFSLANANIAMTFKINKPYNPNERGVANTLQQAIFEALYKNKENNYTIVIEEGFYNPLQMTTTLTNKFNEAITNYVINYFRNTGYDSLIDEFISLGGYNQFVIVYNDVSQKIWFGNKSSVFILTNSTQLKKDALTDNLGCGSSAKQVPDFSEWGLPANLGLSRCDIESIENKGEPIRFFYGNVQPGDNGYWLLPDPILPNSTVSYIECPFKINLMGPSCFYIEIPQLNSIDETQPFNVSPFTMRTNQTNGIVNSAFAKIDVTAAPLSQFFSRDAHPYKFFIPPLERLRRLNFRFRYHNGQLVDFGVFNFTFMIEFTCMLPQQPRAYKTVF